MYDNWKTKTPEDEQDERDERSRRRKKREEELLNQADFDNAIEGR